MSHDLLASYVPSWLRPRPRRTPPFAEEVRGAFLFSDISGFTALTEKLQARGRQGAEEIADAVSRAFRPAIRTIGDHGGSILAFGGDALLAGFRDPGGVAQAVAAAADIAKSFRKRRIETSVGQVKLGVKQAIHHGGAKLLHLGRADRRHFVVAGPAIVALARLEAEGGTDLVLSPGARAATAACRGGFRERQVEALAVEPYLPESFGGLVRGFGGAYRRVAVLFVESAGASMRTLQRVSLALLDVLPRYGGLLLKTDLSTEGTKWIVVFGIPAAEEDLGDRAARAALEVLAAVGAGAPAVVRGGLHAGVVANVILGSPLRRSFDVMGDAVNTAARAMAKARWGEVLVSEDLRRELAGVETADRGEHAVKGKAKALQLHALVATKTAAAVQIRVSAPMVGRDRELAQIREALERAKAGQGSVIAVEGLPGLGKSRLKWEAAKVSADMGIPVHEGRAISFGGMSYWSIGELLRHALHLPVGAAKGDVLAAVQAAADRLGLKSVDRHHLAEVLGARFEGSPIAHLKPQDIRLNNTLAIRTYLLALARKEGPLMLVLEDMHWSDEVTREAVEWLVKHIASAPILLLLLHRPGYEPPKQTGRIALGELGQGDVGEMLTALLGEVPAKVAGLVADKAAGNPFYVEELVRHLLESGILGLSDAGYELLREPGPEDLPDRVESVIAARLDRLTGDVKRVAQVGAVIGRSFLYELLEHLEQKGAREAVGDLSARELVFEKAREPHLEYVWKHALTRDVAYAGILAARKRKLHAAVAEAIETVLADEREGFLPMLGHHWEQAGAKGRARECYLAGARRAASSYAHEEAERLYRGYLALVERPTAESIRARNELGERVLRFRGRTMEAEAEQKLALEQARVLGDRAMQGESMKALAIVCAHIGRSEEAQALYQQAVRIHREVGDRPAESVVLCNLGHLYYNQGRTEEARALYEQALLICREVGSRRVEGIVLGNCGHLLRSQGRLEGAWALYEQALGIFRELADRCEEGRMISNLACLRRDRGRIEEARELCEKALRIEREVGNRPDEGYLIATLAALQHEQGRTEEARALYEQALDIQREVGTRDGQGMVLGNLANLLTEQGRMEEARALYEQALVIYQEVGNRADEGNLLGNLANLHLAVGRTEEAQALYKQALRIHRDTGNRRAEGIVLCGMGDHVRSHGPLAEARPLYEQALAICREIGNQLVEGVTLGGLGAWSLLATGAVEPAGALVSDGASLVEGVGDKVELGKLRCVQGHIMLASGTDPVQERGEVLRLTTDVRAGAESELAKAAAKLERARKAFLAGKPLISGYAPEDLTDSQLRWLREHRPDAIPPDVMARLNEDGTLRPEESADLTTPAAEL